MNRAFLSLYFFIVTSVIFIGWGLNQFWENLAPEQADESVLAQVFGFGRARHIAPQPGQ